MRSHVVGSRSLVLALFLLSIFIFMEKKGIFVVQASSDTYQGDLILKGNNVTVLEGTFSVNGSIVVLDNATLILRNAILNLTQTEDWQHGIILTNSSSGRPRLQVSNTTVTSDYMYSVELYKNSSTIVHGSKFTATPGRHCWFWTVDSASASLHNLTVRGVSSRSTSRISIFESSIDVLNIYSYCFADVENSLVDTMNSYEDADVSSNKSTIRVSQVFDSSTQKFKDSVVNEIRAYNQTYASLTNSTYDNCIIHDQSQVSVFWNLDVHITDEVGQNVPSANVTALYPNGTLATFKLTDADGRAELTLMEKIINVNGTYSVGDYTVKAVYETYSEDATLDLTENRQITLQFQFIIPEFSSLFIHALLFFATAMIITHCRKKRL